MTDERIAAQIDFWADVGCGDPPETAKRAKVRARITFHWERENGRLAWRAWPRPTSGRSRTMKPHLVSKVLRATWQT